MISKEVDINTLELSESKFDIVLKVIKTLLVTTNYFKDFVSNVNNDHEAKTLQTRLSNASPGFLSKKPMMLPV